MSKIFTATCKQEGCEWDDVRRPDAHDYAYLHVDETGHSVPVGTAGTVTTEETTTGTVARSGRGIRILGGYHVVYPDGSESQVHEGDVTAFVPDVVVDDAYRRKTAEELIKHLWENGQNDGDVEFFIREFFGGAK